MKSNDPNNLKQSGEPKVKHKKSATYKGIQKPDTLGKAAALKREPQGQKPSLIAFTMVVIYKNLYILGIAILRRQLRITRRLRKVLARFKGALYASVEYLTGTVSSLFKRFIKRVRAPFLRISETRQELQPVILAARARGQIPLSAYLRIAGTVFRLLRTIMVTVFNYLAPIAAAWLLVNVVRLYIGQPLALAVEYNGEVIGYVKNESDFEDAAQTLRDRFISTSTADVTIDIPRFELVGVVPEEYQSPNGLLERLMRIRIIPSDYTGTDELADKMVQASDNEIEHAYGFYVDNGFYGAVTNRELLTDLLQQIREDNLLGEAEEERVEFTKSISVKEGLYPVDSVVTEEAMRTLAYSNETVDEIYIVEAGDTPSGIAEKHGIPTSVLIEINPGIENQLTAGQEVYLSVAKPFLSVKNIATILYEEDAPYEIEEVLDSMLHKDTRKVEQEGVPGVQQVRAEVTIINGAETERTILETKITKEPVNEVVRVGTMVTPPPGSGTGGGGGSTIIDPGGYVPPAGSGGFIWPTVGGYATTYANHSGNGVDIARPHGTPIYASRSGTVIRATYGYTGYGTHVIIDHGDGYQTLYAHASSLNVQVGQWVDQGTIIAGIGRTGWATGNHVHFEIRYNGGYLWPVDYIGRSG